MPYLGEVRFGRAVRVAVAGVLLAAGLHPSPGLAACRPDDGACLEQEGDNDTAVEVENEGQGGDAIAGSQVISVTGGGNTNITANNQSRFARARGGDVDSKVNVNVDNGPRLRVSRPSSEPSATSSGQAVTVQEADPRGTITLDQTGSASGDSVLTATGLAAGFATGASVLSQTLGPRAASVGSNAAFVTGSAPVTQIATAFAAPLAVAAGPGAWA